MISIGANGNKMAYGIKHFILDREADLAKVNANSLTPGSTAFSIENSQYYMLNHQKMWVKIKSNGGGGVIPGGDEYDGGEIHPGYKPTPDSGYDGGEVKPGTKPADSKQDGGKVHK